jgi:hypothetical protein
MTSLLRLGRSPRPQRMSATLRRLAHQIEDRIRLSEFIGHLGDRIFAAILLVFAIPNLIPLPPGSSTVLGIPLILAAPQLAMGRSSLWLPQVVGNRTLLRSDLERLVYHGVPALRRLERLLVPRLGPLLNERLIGAACLLLAVILILPIPFGNMLPVPRDRGVFARAAAAGWAGRPGRLGRDPGQLVICRAGFERSSPDGSDRRGGRQSFAWCLRSTALT